MKYVLPVLFCLALFLGKGKNNFGESFFPKSYNPILDKPPEFFVLEWKKGTTLSPKETDLFLEMDSLGQQAVVVLVNEKKDPVLYSSNISTPVCADGECKLMHIRLYWTLLGAYAGFDRYPELPLTKHDHDEFKVDDYQKLHRLLTDDKSILKRRRIDQLVEKPTTRTVNGVDALSGATITEVKESVVSGALYSCYVAWHLAHGDVRNKIKEHSLSVINTNMIIDMLYSTNIDYQLYALKEIDKNQYIEHYLQIANIFKEGVPLVRSIIAKDLPLKYLDSPELQKPFWNAFGAIDSGSRSLLLKHLDNVPSFVPDMVSAKLGVMTKNQLKLFLEFLVDKKPSEVLKENLITFADSEKETYAYLVKSYLEDSEY